MERRGEPEEGLLEVPGEHRDNHSEKDGSFLGAEDVEQMEQAVDIVTESLNFDKKRKPRLGKLVKLRAYNIFAVKVRAAIKHEFESVTGHEVARIVGQKWVTTPDQDKAQYFEQAQREHNELVEKGLIDPTAPQRKPRKNKLDMEGEATPGEQPVKRRRGRPRKSETLAAQGVESGGDVLTLQKPEEKPKRQRKKKSEAAAPAIVDVALIGQQVSGVLDGSFDAGYLLSVRVGNTGTVLRGVVFGPGLAVPVSRMNDVAPTVNHMKRNYNIPVPPVVAAASPGVMAAATAVLPTGFPPVVQGPTGLQALPVSFLPQTGYSSASYTSSHVSQETVHRHVNLQSGS